MNRLATRYPRTLATLSALPEGEGLIEHIRALEENFSPGPRSIRISHDGPGDDHVPPQYDVALAGGGLSLIYAAFLARAGQKVVVFDRRRIGCGHREWNVSRAELSPLCEAGLFSSEEIDELVLMQYRHGVCRWHRGGSYPVSGVLDCVVNAEALLDGLRRRALAAGATLLDHHQLLGYRTGTGGVAVTLRDLDPRGIGAGIPGGGSGTVELTARLLIDGMGAQSPHAAFDLCCPTVGGVMGGVPLGKDAQGLDPEVGEILVTTEDVEEGRQHIWEGFPAPGGGEAGAGRMTIYLFYYAEPGTLPQHPLLALYERFFQTLPRYKRGAPRIERATYGFIPAYTRLRPMPVSPQPRVLLVGDAASRHSPLTFCGFGSMIRSFHPVGQGVLRCLQEDRLGRRDLARVWGEPPALRVMGGLTLMMMPQRQRIGLLNRLLSAGRGSEASVNRLLDAAFASLAEAGQDTYASFIRDEIGFGPFVGFMRATARRYPAMYREVFSHLTLPEVALWLGQLFKLMRSPKPAALLSGRSSTGESPRAGTGPGAGADPGMSRAC